MLLIGDEHLCEVLGEAECRRLIGAAGIGRLGYTEGALPEVRPVPFSVQGEELLIPARDGSASLTALAGTVVVLAVDSWAQQGRPGDADGGGWSISLVGLLRVDRVHIDPVSVNSALHAPLSLAVRHLRLRPGIVRGWRVRPGAA